MCCVFAAEVERAGPPLNIPYDADDVIAFGERGEAVLTGEDGNIYLYQHDGVQYSLSKNTSLPEGVERSRSKAVSSTTVFVQDFKTDAPTHVLHRPGLQHNHTVHHKGALRGLLHSSTFIYSRTRARNDYVITLHRPDDAEMTLQPPPGRQWNQWLSVAAAGAYLIVVDGGTDTMTIFSANGNILLLFCHMTNVHMNM